MRVRDKEGEIEAERGQADKESDRRNAYEVIARPAPGAKGPGKARGDNQGVDERGNGGQRSGVASKDPFYRGEGEGVCEEEIVASQVPAAEQEIAVQNGLSRQQALYRVGILWNVPRS